ncbi:MAG: extracellular solute-binding protein [Anaerolineae bacterium]|nr:extracellular solute-binding protein [Anaerolineae bacterium]
MRQIRLSVICGMLLLFGCSSIPPLSTQTPSSTVTLTAVSNDVSTPAPIVTAENANTPRTLRVWIPDALLPVDQPEAEDQWNDQIDAFLATQTNITIEIRRKRSQDIGGIMGTLRTASVVAPGALPDVTLMRVEDLIAAEQGNLIQPLEGRISSSVLGNLYPIALQMGQIEQQLYGLPYLLDVSAMIYRPENNMPTRWTLNTLIEREITLVFPGTRPDVLLLQYFSAGGTPPAEGAMILNPIALQTVLTFYEQAQQENLITSEIFTYTSALDYRARFWDQAVDAAVINVSSFNAYQQDEIQFTLAPIPTVSGDPLTVMNGWVWVIIASDLEQQDLSARFINWMMDEERQRQMAQHLTLLPSQRDALRAWSVEGIETDLMDQLLTHALLPITEVNGGRLIRAMQTALAAVLNGSQTAEEAVNAVIDEVDQQP